MRALFRKLRSGFRQPAFVLLWLLPVWGLLNLCRLLIAVLSFRRQAGMLGRAQGSHACIPLADLAQQARATKIRQVVKLAARLVPWGVNCYPQALVACLLMEAYRVPHCLCFGAARSAQNGAFAAHAWTAAGPVRVTGGESFRHYAVLACFVSLPGRDARMS